jgi:hypothetical protein
MITKGQVFHALIGDGLPRHKAIAFIEEHTLHPKVSEWFDAEALRQIHAGAARLSSKDIGETIRKQRRVHVTNDHWSYYARVFALRYPIFGKLFEFKALGRMAA